MRRNDTIVTVSFRAEFTAFPTTSVYQQMTVVSLPSLVANGFVIKFTGTAAGTGAAANQMDQQQMRLDYCPYV
jgi:hypothetical protein